MPAPLPPLPSPDVADIAETTRETMEWLRANIKVGFTSERGPAWWANATTKDGKWDIPDGSHFDGPVPMDEVRKLLDVPFAKGEVHVTYTDEDGNRQVAGDEHVQPVVNIRTGKVFSYPTAKYAIHPYLETLAEFMRAIQYDQDVEVGSVGLLKGGGQAFLQARLPESLIVANYEYVPYMLGTTSVDLSRSTIFSTGGLAGVCDNTITRALDEALTALRIRHSANSVVTVQKARESLGLQLRRTGDAIGTAIDQLAHTKVSEDDFAAWLDEMVPEVEPDFQSATGGRKYTMAKNKRGEMTRLYVEDPKVAPWNGTAFGVYQLDNTYRTWNGIVRGAHGGRIERNFTALADGGVAKADALALETLARVMA